MFQQTHSLVFIWSCWKLYSYKIVHIDIYRSFIHNWQNLETTKNVTDEWVNKLWYIWTMGYYLGLKRNELSSHEKTGRKLKCILLNKRSHSERLHTVWFHLHNILEKVINVQGAGIKTIPKKKKCKKAKWLSEEALQVAVKRREAKGKGEKERYSHLNAEFQRIARRDKKGFLSDQCKEIEEKSRMWKLGISSR